MWSAEQLLELATTGQTQRMVAPARSRHDVPYPVIEVLTPAGPDYYRLREGVSAAGLTVADLEERFDTYCDRFYDAYAWVCGADQICRVVARLSLLEVTV